MIAARRSLHRRTVFIGAPLLFALLVGAYLDRPRIPQVRNESLPQFATQAREAWFVADDLFDQPGLRLEFFGPPGKVQLGLTGSVELPPDLLVYYLSQPSANPDPSSGRLLGRMAAGPRRLFAMPEEWRGGGQVLLYSLAHMQTVSVSARLPRPGGRR